MKIKYLPTKDWKSSIKRLEILSLKIGSLLFQKIGNLLSTKLETFKHQKIKKLLSRRLDIFFSDDRTSSFRILEIFSLKFGNVHFGYWISFSDWKSCFLRLKILYLNIWSHFSEDWKSSFRKFEIFQKV